jgi:hypothetical protein
MNNHVFPLNFSAGKFFLQFSHRVSWESIDEKYLFIAGKLILADPNDPSDGYLAHFVHVQPSQQPYGRILSVFSAYLQ